MKIHWLNLKIFFSRSTGPISTKLSTKHPWVKGIQVCSIEGPAPFSRGDNCEIVRIHWGNLEIFSRTQLLISTNFNKSSSSKGDSTFPKRRAKQWKYMDNISKSFSPDLQALLQLNIIYGTNYLWVKGIYICTNKGLFNFQEEANYFEFLFSFNQHDGKIIFCEYMFIDWNCFSGERLDPWAFWVFF